MTKRVVRNEPISISDTYPVFFDAVQRGSLEELVKAAWKVFGLPVMLIDKNDQPICQFPDQILGDATWDRYYNKNPLEAEERELSRVKVLADKPSFFEPFTFYLDENHGGGLFGQIHFKAVHYGYFCVQLFNHPLDKDDLERAKIFSQALGLVMHHQSSCDTESSSSLLLELLSEDTGEYVRSRAAAALGKQLKGRYAVLVKPIEPNASSSTFAVAAMKHIQSLGPNFVAAVRSNCLMVLCGEMQRSIERDRRQMMERIDDFLRPAGNGAGCSAVFDDLFHVQRYALQAHMTALHSKNALAFYEEIAPAPLFQLAAHHGDGEAFLAPILRVIHDYDRENRTEYFQTLRAYSLFLHNKELAAQKLCIHRNTLLYRLNRIEEIFGLSYEEPRTALHLLNSFQLWDVMKKE